MGPGFACTLHQTWIRVSSWPFPVAYQKNQSQGLLHHSRVRGDDMLCWWRLPRVVVGVGWMSELQLTDLFCWRRLLLLLRRPCPALSTADFLLALPTIRLRFQPATIDLFFEVRTGVEATAATSRPDPDCAIISGAKGDGPIFTMVVDVYHRLNEEREHTCSHNTCLLYVLVTCSLLVSLLATES